MSTREQMIDKLIRDDILFIKRALQYGDTEYLSAVLREGVSYSNWTTDQIKIEFLERGWE